MVEAGSSEVEGRAAASGAARSESAGVTDDEARVLLPETAAPLFFFPGLVAMPTVAVAGAGFAVFGVAFVVEFVVEGGFVGAGDDDRGAALDEGLLVVGLVARVGVLGRGGVAGRGEEARDGLAEGAREGSFDLPAEAATAGAGAGVAAETCLGEAAREDLLGSGVEAADGGASCAFFFFFFG